MWQIRRIRISVVLKRSCCIGIRNYASICNISNIYWSCIMPSIKRAISLLSGLLTLLSNTILLWIWVVINIQCFWPASWLQQKWNIMMLSQISLLQERRECSLATYMSLVIAFPPTTLLSKPLVGFIRAMSERRRIIDFVAGLFFRIPTLILSMLNLNFRLDLGI